MITTKAGTGGQLKLFVTGCLDIQSLQNPDTPIQIKTCVKDLGELVHYNKGASIGFIREKIEEGVRRIQRIEWLPCDLQKKALFIQTAVWPFALYSCDTMYIGQKHFEKLRRATVNTLAGHRHNASPLLACNFLSKFLTDPFLHTLCQCVRIVRRPATVQPEITAQAVAFAASYDGSRPFGPASALRHYFNQVGWHLDIHGNVTGPEHYGCNILGDSIKKIVNTFRAMWVYNVVWSMDRKGVGDHLPDPRCGLRVFSACSDEVQQLIKLNVVGGYQTQSMKAKWDKDTDDSCVFCGECDTRDHRLLHCSVGLSIREAFPDAIVTLKDHRPEWIYVPLPRQHDMALLLRAYLKLVKPPVIPAAYDVPADTLRFFTDGGAIHPACANARIASWSVVQDVADSDKHRKDVACFLSDVKPRFPCFSWLLELFMVIRLWLEVNFLRCLQLFVRLASMIPYVMPFLSPMPSMCATLYILSALVSGNFCFTNCLMATLFRLWLKFGTPVDSRCRK